MSPFDVFVARITESRASPNRWKQATWKKTWLKSTFRLNKLLHLQTNGYNELMATVNWWINVNGVAAIIMFN